MQSSSVFENPPAALAIRLHRPASTVQHCAAIGVSSGPVVAVGSVMHTPEPSAPLPWRAHTPSLGKSIGESGGASGEGGGGGTEGGDGEGGSEGGGNGGIEGGGDVGGGTEGDGGGSDWQSPQNLYEAHPMVMCQPASFEPSGQFHWVSELVDVPTEPDPQLKFRSRSVQPMVQPAGTTPYVLVENSPLPSGAVSWVCTLARRPGQV